MKFEPYDGDGDFPILSPGIYDADIHQAEEKISKAGNDMFEIVFNVYGEDGSPCRVWDYIVPASAGWKFRQLCEAVGLAEKYATGEIDPDDLLGKALQLEVRVEPATSQYRAGNKASAYLPPVGPPRGNNGGGAEQTEGLRHANAIADGDVPF